MSSTGIPPVSREEEENPGDGGMIKVCSIGLVEDILRHAGYREAGLLSVSCKSIGDSVGPEKHDAILMTSTPCAACLHQSTSPPPGKRHLR